MGSGLIFALASVVMTSVTNTLQEFIADRYQASASLLLQYVFLVICAAVMVLVMDTFVLPNPTPQFIGMLAVTGVIGYLGIRLLFRALSKLDVAVVMTIAFSYVFFSYFLNIALFPEVEQLTLGKILLAVAFFIVVSALLFEKNTSTQKLEINRAMLLPLGTALCWSIFFAFINYFVKDGYLSPFQSVFYTEGIIFVVALLEYLLVHRTFSDLRTVPQRVIGYYALRGVCAFSMGLLTYYAYQYAAANMVNIVKLSSIILTAIFGRLFLKERLSRKEISLMLVSVIILGMFVLV